jgi:RHS repeat-associated protein
MNLKNFGKLGASGFVLGLMLNAAPVLLGLGVSAPAQASGGQCRWEGGPGGGACDLEDCLEDGGKAMCMEPEIRPPGGNDAAADGQKFQYHACDVAGPQMWRIARWCTAMDGTWQAPSHPECLNPVYPTSESAVLQDGMQFMSGDDPNCQASVAGDTGWGLSDPSDQLCWSGADTFKNGELMSSMRRQDFTNGQNCLAGSVKYLKTREMVCPMKYASRNRYDGTLQCYICASCISQGNPVSFPSGAKIHHELDYQSADGLEVARYYNSLARFAPRGTGAKITTRSDVWRASYTRRVIMPANNSYVWAYVQEDGGNLQAFNFSGVEIQKGSGGSSRLVAIGPNWKLTKSDGAIDNFDSQGRLTSAVTRSGVTTTLTYDAAGRLSTVSNQFGRTLTYGYGANDRLIAVTLPDTRQIQYSYDSRDRPTAVTYPDGATKTYHYEHPSEWLLTGITDENGSRFSTYVYDEALRVASEEHAGGVDRRSFYYGSPIESTTSTSMSSPYGQSLGYWMTNAGGSFKYKTAPVGCTDCPDVRDAGFDENGNYAWKVDRNNNVTTYQYDLTRNLEVSRTEGLGQYSVITNATRTITTQWHGNLRFPIEQKIYVGANASDVPLRITSFSYDSSGNVLTKSITDPASSASRTWTYTYDSLGRTLTEDGPRSDVPDITTFVYYSCAAGPNCGRLHTVTNALNQLVSYEGYNADGNPTLITDVNGVQTSIVYDFRQRPIATTSNFGNVSAETSTFEYWPTGFLKKVTQPDGSFVTFTYDAAHRLSEIADNSGNSQKYVYDVASQITATNTFDPFGTLVGSRRQLYNSLGRLWQILSAAGTDSQTTVLGYDNSGNLTTINAPMGRTAGNVYDELSRLKRVIDPSGSSTTFSYDALDNLKEVVDPRGLATSYTNSAFNELTQKISPDTGTTIYSYDTRGNLISSTTARNVVTSSTYDALNRITSRSYKVGPTTDQVLTFTYDQGNNGKGRLTAASDASHSLAWSYDAIGRVTNKTQVVGGISHSATYGYVDGHLSSFVTPSGQSIAYQYDIAGRISSVAINGIPLLSAIQHEPFGAIAGWTWGNSTLTVRSFDLDGQLTLIDSAGLSSYAYFDDGNIGSRSDDRDTNYNHPTGTTIHSVAGNSNRLMGSTGALTRSYSFDGVGNLTGNGEAAFTYNFANRMNSATRSGITANYTYDALGQRVRKLSGPSTTYFFYDEAGQLIGEYDGAGTLIQETVWLENIPVATLRPKTGGGVDVYYVHSDHLNTPRRITKPSSNVVIWRWDSDPFGLTLANGDPDGDSQLFAYGLRFSGQYFDAETGLHYNYFRDYDPATGRYNQSDPIGLEGGVNTYAYANGNPIESSDHFGLLAKGGNPGSSAARIVSTALARAAGANRASGGPTSPLADAFAAGVFIGTIGYEIYDLCRPTPKCELLLQEAEARKDVVVSRYFALLKDQWRLYDRDHEVKLSNRRGSWNGHLKAYYEAQVALRDAISRAIAAGCTPTPDQLAWMVRPAPDKPLPR